MAIMLYLLPFVTLALILGFICFAARMAKEPVRGDDSQAEDEALVGDESEAGFLPPMLEDTGGEGSVIRVTRAHDRYTQS